MPVPSHPAKPPLLYRLPSIIDQLDLKNLFESAEPAFPSPSHRSLEVELGSGDGSFLVDYAKRNPGRDFIGIERLLGRIRKMERKAWRAGVNSLRGIRIESRYFLQYLLPEGCADALHVYFPDPWPKRRHWHHRLVNEQFPALARRVLAPGGRVYLRTDDPDYFAQMQAVFSPDTGFRAVDTPLALIEVTTDFEREFNARGIPTLRAAFQVNALPSAPAV